MEKHARPRLGGALALSGLFVSCLFLAAPSEAAFELRPFSPAERSCSGPEALGLVDGSTSSVFHASGARRSEGVVDAYGYRPFGVAGIDVVALRGKVTLSGGRAGACFSYSGLAAPGYFEQTAAFSVALRRGDLWLQPGLRLGEAISPGLYEGRCMAFDLLIYARVTPRLRVSFDIGNAFASGLGVAGGGVPRRVGAGVGYAVSGSAACGFRLEKENGLRTAYATGLEWRAMRGILVRLGSSTFPMEFSFGLGLRAGGLGLDVSSTVNFDLGMTHEAGIAYSWQ